MKSHKRIEYYPSGSVRISFKRTTGARPSARAYGFEPEKGFRLLGKTRSNFQKIPGNRR
jgi:hypothetical protein